MRDITKYGIIVLLLIYFITDSNTLSIGTVSESEDNVTTTEPQVRESQQELFPDWVPFKNKHGDELGEFKQVPKKMPKKRLALPMNFELKAVADPEGDDYFEKIAGDDSEYEKKGWSDIYRPDTSGPEKVELDVHHTDLSDIEGVVNIIKNTGKQKLNHKTTQEVDEISNSNGDYRGEKNSEEQNGRIDSGEVQTTKKQPSKKHILWDDTEIELDTNDNQNVNNYSNKRNRNSEPTGEQKTDIGTSSERKNENKSDEEEVNEYDDSSDEVRKTNDKTKAVTEEPDYEEKPPETKQNDEVKVATEEDKENEAQKALILNSVDELKERHAEEQRLISERVKEEQRLSEEVETYKPRNDYGKYSESYVRPNKNVHKYEENDYDDSSEAYVVKDKYKIKHQPRVKTKPITITTTTQIVTSETPYIAENQTGKPSIFKNPQIFVVNDYDEDMPTPHHRRKETTAKKTHAKTDQKILSDNEERIRISLVPVSDNGSRKPALFFPRATRRRPKNKSTTASEAPKSNPVIEKVADATAADSISTIVDTAPSNLFTVPSSLEASPTAPEISSTGFGVSGETGPSAIETSPSAGTAPSAEAASDTENIRSSALTVPSTEARSLAIKPSRRPMLASPESGLSASDETIATGPSASSSNADPVTDALSAPSEHKKAPHKKKGHHHHEHEGGGVKEFHSEDEEEHGEHGKKSYKGEHKESKIAKGHHDKEDHNGNYHDHGGHDKKHHDESGHYGHHHHEEAGKKHAKYEESGKHSKGHSTKGSHDVHKKEEYEKKVEFFEEEGDSAEEEKHGGFNEDKEHKSGGKFHNNNLKADHQAHHKGESGHFAKAGHGSGNKGHKSSGGHDSHGRHGQAHFHSDGKEAGKKWIFHQGYPAKTANLVVIDRRGDQMQHGPSFYG